MSKVSEMIDAGLRQRDPDFDGRADRATASVDPARQRLVEARDRLRRVTDDEEWARAQAEVRAIAQAGGDAKALGGNEAERKRALVIALAADPEYQRVLQRLRDAQRHVEETQALVDTDHDRMRAQEITSRDKLADAITGCARLAGTPFTGSELR